VARPAAAETRKLLVTKAQWVDTAQQTGTMLFQGEVTDGVLTGRAYPGGGIELVVQGTVSSTGQVAGTLRTAENQELAGFTATLNAAQELEGALTINGEAAAAWIAPAEQLPTS
jgi:hypothetical protein